MAEDRLGVSPQDALDDAKDAAAKGKQYQDAIAKKGAEPEAVKKLDELVKKCEDAVAEHRSDSDLRAELTGEQDQEVAEAFDVIRDIQESAKQAFDIPGRKTVLKRFLIGAKIRKTVPSVLAAGRALVTESKSYVKELKAEGADLDLLKKSVAEVEAIDDQQEKQKDAQVAERLSRDENFIEMQEIERRIRLALRRAGRTGKVPKDAWKRPKHASHKRGKGGNGGDPPTK